MEDSRQQNTRGDTFEYDAFNRLRTIRNRSNSALVEEYTYNGLGHRIGWHYDVDADGTVESNADDPWYYFAYDESWRMVATFRDDDAEPKEVFINHQAGLGGMSLSLGLDATILRDRDTKGEWWEEADIRNERVYYCQDLRNGRADVLCLVRDDGTRVESVRYSPYGVPFGIPGPDANGDGLVNSADLSVVLSSQGKSVGDPGYTVLADINLDGTVNSADLTLLTGYAGGAMGRGVLSNSVTRSRKGYAGYEHDGVIHVLAHVRHRVYEIERGRWIQRDPLGFVDGGSWYAYGKNRPIVGIDPDGLETYIGGVGNYTGPGLGNIWTVDRQCLLPGGCLEPMCWDDQLKMNVPCPPAPPACSGRTCTLVQQSNCTSVGWNFIPGPGCGTTASVVCSAAARLIAASMDPCSSYGGVTQSCPPPCYCINRTTTSPTSPTTGGTGFNIGCAWPYQGCTITVSATVTYLERIDTGTCG